MILAEHLEQTKKLLKKEPKPRIVKVLDDELKRKLLEQGTFDILLSPEAGKRKDALKQLDSGLNHVLVRLAQKHAIALGIDIQEISHLSKKEKALRIARIRQNLRLLKKSTLRALNIKDLRNTQSLLQTLGASSQQAKKAISL